MHELRGTLWELKPGSRRSAPGLHHTSFTIPPAQTAHPVEETNQRRQVEQVVLPQPPAGTAGEDTATRVTEGEPQTTPIR